MAYVTLKIQKVDRDAKEKVIEALCEGAGISFNAAKSIFGCALIGRASSLEVPAENAEKLMQDLIECNSEVTMESPIPFEISDNPDAEFHPIVPADAVSTSGRQESMDILAEVGKIAVAFEYYASKETELLKQIEFGKQAAEKMRTELSPEANKKVWIGAIVGGILGTFIVPILCTAIGAVIVAFIVRSIVSGPDLELHKAENDARADEYIRDKVAPKEAQLEDLRKDRDSPISRARREWALDIVGEDLFYSPCINDLHDLIKSRRADTIKEALNKYDDEQYKARMAEMQKAVQSAAEATAAESAKQTAKMGEIARTARINTAINYGTYRNTKKINDKLK